VADLVRSLAVCPACRGRLEWGETIRCEACGRTYDRKDEVPALVADLTEHQRAQARFVAAESESEVEFETTRPHGLPRFHSWLLEEKYRLGTDALGAAIRGSVLVVCGGAGMDAEFIARLGGRAITSDISAEASARALERARRFGFDVEAVAASAERLPFPDRSVDVAFVHDGLHHLEEPIEAVRELARVARLGVSINEPADALLTRGAVRIGQAEEVEEAGNIVGRLRLGDVARTLEAEGLRVVAARRYAMFYRHRPGTPSRLLSRPGLFPVATTAMRLGNAALGRIGNKLTVQAVRP
jgi:SAM-dependent methyltransferase